MLKILNHNSYLYSQVWYDMPLILWRQRQADLCKLEATPITEQGPDQQRATQQDSFSKKEKQKQLTTTTSKPSSL